MAVQDSYAIDDCDAETNTGSRSGFEGGAQHQIAQLQASNAALEAQVAQLRAENQRLRQTHWVGQSPTDVASHDLTEVAVPTMGKRQSAKAKSQGIKAQEAILRSIYEGIELCIFVLDITPMGEVRFAALNPAYERIMGFTEAQLMGKTPTEANFPTAEAVTQNYQRCRVTGSPLYYEELAVLHGRNTYLYTTLIPVAVDGRIVRIIGTSLDITHLKQMEDQLRQSEATKQAILAAMPDLLLRVGRDGACYDCILPKGGKADQFLPLSHNVREVLPADLFALYVERLDRALTTGEMQTWEQTLMKNGQCCYEEVRLVTCGDDECLVVVRDISDRKCIEAAHQQAVIDLQQSLNQLVATQAALQTSKMQFSSVLNSSLDSIMAFRALRDETNAIVDFEWLLSNPAACELMQRPAETLIGRQLLQEMPVHKTNGLFDRYVQVVETGNPWQQEFHYTQKDCGMWLGLIAVQLGDGFAVTFRDITGLKQAELALQSANQQLGQQVNQLNQRNAEMLLLGEMSDCLQTCLTVDAAYNALASLVAPLFPDCGGGVQVVNPTDGQLQTVAHWGDVSGAAVACSVNDCWALQRARSHWTDADHSHVRCRHLESVDADLTTLCVPMGAQGETLGLLYFGTTAPGALSRAKQQLAKTVAEQLALALANLQLRDTLRHQSIRDSLTGLYNRRYLEEALQQEIILAQRHQHPIGVIMLDIDHFKVFNDTYGHDAGDRALQAVGQLLKDSVRGSDIACRYGGEEITLILPASALAETQVRAETIRQAISCLHLPEQEATLTASLGLAGFPHHGTTSSGLLKAADTALYRAKQAGRNCVVVIETESTC